MNKEIRLGEEVWRIRVSIRSIGRTGRTAFRSYVWGPETVTAIILRRGRPGSAPTYFLTDHHRLENRTEIRARNLFLSRKAAEAAVNLRWKKWDKSQGS